MFKTVNNCCIPKLSGILYIMVLFREANIRYVFFYISLTVHPDIMIIFYLPN